MKLIVRLAINAAALLVVGYLVPGFHLANFWVAVVAAIVIGIVNTLVRPILQIIAFPISILTFGIAALVINVLLLWGCSTVVPGFKIDGFWTAALGSVVLSVVSWFLNKLASN
jgi:putative membrane protein